MIDFNSDLAKRVIARAQTDSTIWLTTISPSGMPQPRPVWFMWDETTNTILTRTYLNGKKVAHIRHNPNVALNFDTNGQGGDVQVILDTAEVLTEPLPAATQAAYAHKYVEGLKRFGMDAETFAKSTIVIRISPTKLR